LKAYGAVRSSSRSIVQPPADIKVHSYNL
jgi:hypothetical protein